MFKFLTVILLFLTGIHANASLSPVGIGIVSPVQFPPSDFDIVGFRVSALWGQTRDLYGLDFGVLGNITDQDFAGLAVSGLFNITHGQTKILGLQLAGATNITTNKTTVIGFQIAGGVNYMEASSTVAGVQLALLANLGEHTDIYGMQIGLYNRALSVHGFQIGLVNVADNVHGLQIGLINFHHKGMFAMAPILNGGF